MTPEERNQLQDWIEKSAVREFEWYQAKINLKKIILYLRKENNIEELRKFSFEMTKLIAQNAEDSKKQNEEMLAYAIKRLKE